MQYGKAVAVAFAYARHSKAVPAFLALTLGGLIFLGISAALLIPIIAKNPTAFMRDPAAFGPAVSVLLAEIAAFFLAAVALSGVVIHNCVHPEGLRQSWREFSPRLWTLVALSLFTTIAGFAISVAFEGLMKAAPAFFGILSVLNIAVTLALAFFLAFTEYAAVLEGTGFSGSIRTSIKLALEKPVDVLLAIAVSSIVALAALLALLATLVLGVSLVLTLTRVSVASFSPPALAALSVGSILALAGIFFIQVFQYHFMAQAFTALSISPEKKAEKAPDAKKRKTTTTIRKGESDPAAKNRSHRPARRRKT